MYPDLEDARILRRKFLAIVGGGVGAAALFGACGGEEPDHSARTPGTPPAIDPETVDSDPVRRLPGRPMIPKDPPVETPDAGSKEVPAEKPGDRHPGRQPRPDHLKKKPKKKKREIPPEHKLGGEPLRPDLKL